MDIPASLILLLLLLLLIIAILFSSYAEGFVSFAQSENALVNVIIPQYSNTKATLKLHDNLFFDRYNANLIEVDSTLYSGNIDMTGNTISKITVAPRMETQSTTYTVSTTTNVIPTGSNITSKSMSSKVYETKSEETDKYTIFYMPWLYSTYVHILNTTSKQQIANFMFGTGNVANSHEFKKRAFRKCRRS